MYFDDEFCSSGQEKIVEGRISGIFGLNKPSVSLENWKILEG